MVKINVLLILLFFNVDKNILFLGLKCASNKLKQHYIEELIDWIIDQPLISNEADSLTRLSREDAYVDLAVVSSGVVDSVWKSSDREAIIKMGLVY